MNGVLKVLHLEDNPNDAELVEATLRDAGMTCEITRVQSRAEFVAALNGPPWDLILADYALPSFDGLSALKIAGENTPQTPFIFVSGAMGEDTAVETLKVGATDYVVKHRLARLTSVVRRALDGAEETRKRREAEEEIRRLNVTLERRVAEVAAANRELERLRRQAELILNSAGEGIFRLDLDGKCTYANPAAARILGYARKEFLGQDPYVLGRHTSPDGTPCKLEGCRPYGCLEPGGAVRAENQIFHRKDGVEIVVDSVATPIHEDGKITGAVLAFRDVSERRAIEKMKDEFVSMVSHELRTPLTVIRAALGLLAAGHYVGRPDRTRHLLDLTVKNTERLSRLINNILDSQRLEAYEVPLVRQRCLASDLMIQATDLMRPMAETAHVTIEATPQPAPLLVDQDSILQVLTNLLSNAIKFSPARSAVHLGIERGHEAAVFKVVDEGQGIPADKLESIFERFRPVDASDSRQRGGTGLGLFICRKIVQRHGGRIWAESELGRGSTFTFTLPLEPPEEIAMTIRSHGRSA